MPDIFDLDRAFDALAHDVMDRTSPPSAVHAIEQARRRRRTAIATVALAAAVAVAGVAVPTLLLDRSGVEFADGLPESAPLDAAALNDATRGWISGWSDEPGGPWSQPGCLMGSDEHPEPTELRRSNFGGGHESSAMPLFLTFDSATSAESAWKALNAPLTRCPGADVTETTAPDYPDGTAVRHYSVSDRSDDGGAALTDVWVARSGNTVGSLWLTSAAGVASDDAVDTLSDVLVAGMLDGSAQVLEHPQSVPDVKQRPHLPLFDERDLASALDGWRAAERASGVVPPQVPCLPGGRGTAGGSSGERDGGRHYEIKGYLEPGPEAARWMQEAVAQLRDCAVTTMTETALADGVLLFTFELDVEDGHGAIWLAANEDRNMAYSVNGAATPLPDGVGERVGRDLTRALAVPWGPAE
ncbi:hypothetical protein [Nocardioides allogilvus]|uniref:hypothetical protein n=1 Tax=Nocardioides allogilvus TaxID=2072017 RepID=UPI000D31432D|nr:hypothetical protein [Nocardioides allogilvus]